ncbi:hypothetical protein Bca52824_062160 [Brassica carinata]|uniref:Uncharacterized protein n=1 Tax=Brassica carinata TaxID=52824 RepID=A0A8X7QCF2_BRACI|nr:hypothetical protein Bca52824_062160 [Brassica carinata]
MQILFNFVERHHYNRCPSELRNGELSDKTLKNGRSIVNYVQSFKNVSVYSFNTNGLHPEASMKNQSSSIYLQIYTERSNAISVSLLSDGYIHQLSPHKI